MIHFVSNKRRNIFIVADNIYVYDAEGNQIEMIEVPERPYSITFCGKGGNTLYISARSSLYGIELSEL